MFPSTSESFQETPESHSARLDADRVEIVSHLLSDMTLKVDCASHSTSKTKCGIHTRKYKNPEARRHTIKG